jgi:seryl-tRNA synthetase
MSKNNTIKKSDKKYIRTQKSLIRAQFSDAKKQKEMIDSVLENDSTYKDHAEKAKEATRIKSNTKKEIFKRPDVKHVVEKLTEMKDNLSDTREELSNYIQEYAQASGQNYFEAEDGTIQEIVYVAKLRKKAA